MAITHTLNYSITVGGTTTTKTISASGGAEVNLSEAVNDGQTDLQLTYALDQSAMVSFYMWADVAMTIETNNASSPTDSFTLVADEPVVWTSSAQLTNPITADITTLYATNSSGTNGTLVIYALQDPTP